MSGNTHRVFKKHSKIKAKTKTYTKIWKKKEKAKNKSRNQFKWSSNTVTATTHKLNRLLLNNPLEEANFFTKRYSEQKYIQINHPNRRRFRIVTRTTLQLPVR